MEDMMENWIQLVTKNYLYFLFSSLVLYPKELRDTIWEELLD